MFTPRRLLLLCLAMLLLPPLGGCGSSSDPGGGDSLPIEQGAFRLLVFSRTDGFRHASIEIGVEAVRRLGDEFGFDVDHTEDPADFSSENLSRYAAVLWLNTTGNVLNEAQQVAFEQYIAAGGGYAGVHSAADTGFDWPFYGELVGAYFKNHPIFPLGAEGGPGVQAGDLRVEAVEHPSTAHLPDPWVISDEFYSFRRNPRGVVRVLLNIDESTYEQNPNTSNIPGSGSFPLGETGVMNDHPMSWCHDNLGGRAWYTALGHSPAKYTNAAFLQHLLGGILTVARRIPADCTPREDGPLQAPDEGPAVLDGLLG